MKLNIIILAVVTILLGAIMTGIYADQVIKNTALTTASSESISINKARSGGQGINDTEPTSNFTLGYGYFGTQGGGWKSGVSDCNIAVSNVTNASGYTWTATTDYILYQPGILHIVNSSNVRNATSNTTYTTYTYCADGYISSAWGRSVLNITAGFMALLVFGMVVGFIYLIYRDVTH
jgi:hypothetical protein